MPKFIRFGPPGRAPLSAAIRCGKSIYLSGQVPILSDGQVPAGITKQTTLVMDKVSALVVAAGGDMSNIIKTTVFLTKRDDFPGMNEVYKTYFAVGEYPTRSTIECGLMADILVEIEAVAIL